MTKEIYSADELKFDESVELAGNIYTNDKVEIGDNGIIAQNVTANGEIKLKNSVFVQGNVISGAEVDTESGVVVLGNISENTSIEDIPTVTEVQLSVQSGSNDIEVDENESLQLLPGDYGKLKVKKNSVLTLSSGLYRFEEFIIEEESLVNHQIVSGSVLVDVKKKIEIKEAVQLQTVGGTASNILYISEDDIKFNRDTVVFGSFITIGGIINVEEGAAITGALYGDDVVLKKDVQLIGQPAFQAIDDRFNGTISPPNNAPVADAGSDQFALTGDSITLDGSESYDLDGDPLSFQWLLNESPGLSQATLSDPTSVMPTFQVDSVGEYRVQLTVNDGMQDSEIDEVIITTENSQPVADANDNQSVFVGDVVSLDGSNSYDANGDTLTYLWTMTVVPDGSVAQLTEFDSVNPRFTIDIAGQYQVSLIVSDGILSSEPSIVLVNAEFPNTPPVANAGSDRVVNVGSDVILDGTLSSDSDGDDISYQWSLNVVPDQSLAVLDDSTAVAPRFTADQIGQYVAQLITNDSIDNSEPSTVVISVVDPLPVLSLSALSPADFSYINTPTTFVSGSVNRTASVTVNGSDVSVTENLNFSTIVNLQEGENTILIQASNFDANQSDSVSLTVYLDTQIPVAPAGELLSVVSGDEGNVIAGSQNSVEAGAFVSITNLSTGESITVQADASGSFNAVLTGDDGDQFSVVVEDIAGNVSDPTVVAATNNLDLPPEPETIAPPLDSIVPTPMYESIEFLYTGTNPIQTGVNPDAIKPAKVVVIKGDVQNFSGAAIPGVEIKVVGQPGLGKTLSRATGKFDLVLNGGGTSILEFSKPGYLTSQRKVNPKTRTFFPLEPVVLVALDSEVTVLALGENTPMQFASGSTVTDQDGTRAAKLVMPAGTGASMLLPDGSTQSLDTLSFRATEFTVGSSGPNAMPGELPAASGYTYAVELTADEAIAAGASRIDFNQAVYLYVNNFVGFPTGSAVPAGYYDRELASWIPSDNGVVIEILAIDKGLAVLDIDGSGQAATEVELAAIGIVDTELAEMASAYDIGATLWRVPITHFTPWDCNWPAGPPDDAESPPESDNNNDEDEVCEVEGSIIECQNQTLRESLRLHGTPYTLNYSSSRVPGRIVGRSLDLKITGDVVPASLKRVELEISVAGVQTRKTFPAEPNQNFQYTWNGKDGYDRDVIGTRNAKVTISNVYDVQFYEPAEFDQSFNRFSSSGTRISGTRGESEITLSTDQNFAVLKWSDSVKGIGGWTLSEHHVYDPIKQVLYKGDGSQFSAEDSFKTIETIAGTGTVVGYSGDGEQATQAMLRFPNGVKFDQRGRMLIADSANHVIRAVNDEGVITTIAGQGYCGYSGDGGLAVDAEFCFPQSLAIGPDNSIYVNDYNNARVRRIDANGVVTTVAGNGFYPDFNPNAQAYDGMQAIDIPLDIDKMAVSSNGDLYLTYWFNGFVGKVSPNGVFTVVAGGGTLFGSGGDGMPATSVALDAPHAIAIKPNGNLIIAEGYSSSIREVDRDGIISTIAGLGINEYGYSGDGGPATEARIRDTLDVEVAPNGEVYFLQYQDGCIRKIDNNGIISTVAGTCDFTYDFFGDGGPSRQAVFNLPQDIAIGPDGHVYIADTRNHVIRREQFSMPDFSVNDYAIASPDSMELYQFDWKGQHLATFNTLTGHKTREFEYDADGYFVAINDVDNNKTTIERSGNQIAAIVSPYDQRTLISQNIDGYLSVATDPMGSNRTFDYQDNGLLKSTTDAKGNRHQYFYDLSGRLVRDVNPNGGTITLSRIDLINGYEVTLSTAEGNKSTYTTINSGDGDEISTIEGLNGVVETYTRSSDGKTTYERSDDFLEETMWGGDERFGVSVQVASEQNLTLASNLVNSNTQSHSTILGDESNLLSVQEKHTVYTVNNDPTSYKYTAENRTTVTLTPEGRESSVTIDSAGRGIGADISGLSSFNAEYDEYGRLIRRTFGSGQNARSYTQEYDQNGYLHTRTDPLGRTTVDTSVDNNGNVLERQLKNFRRVDYGYDENDNLIQITPPESGTYRFNYDGNNKISSYIAPATEHEPESVTLYNYDLDRRVSSVVYPDSSSATFNYQSDRNRLASITIPEGVYTYLYNDSDDEIDFVDAPGNIQYSRTFDSGIPISRIWGGDIQGTVTQEIDNHFRVKKQQVNDMPAVEFEYDRDGLPIAAGPLQINRHGQKGGLVESTQLGVVATEYTYSDFGEIVSIQTIAGGDVVYRLDLLRDVIGRIVQKTESIQSELIVEVYTYDDFDRLVEVDRNGEIIEYHYDANGNRISTVSGLDIILGAYDTRDRVLSYGGFEFQHSARGEIENWTDLTTGITRQFSHDAFGNLRTVSFSNGVLLEYEIDGSNRRVGVSVDGVLEAGYLYKDQLNPVAQLSTDGSVSAEFVYADRMYTPSFLIKEGISYRIVADHLGSPRLVLNSLTGEVVQRTDYSAFGELIFTSDPLFQPFGFAGGLYDHRTGLLRFGVREYSPSLGRWISADPSLFPSEKALNQYEYVLGNPVNLIDPNGRQGIPPEIPPGGTPPHTPPKTTETVGGEPANFPTDLSGGRTRVEKCKKLLDKCLERGLRNRICRTYRPALVAWAAGCALGNIICNAGGSAGD